MRLRGQLQAQRVQRQVVRPERRGGDRRPRADLPGRRGDHAAADARARRPRARARPERARPAAGGAEAGARGCRGAPTRCMRCTGRGRSRRRRRGGGGSRSTSCSCSSSASRGATREREQEVAPALGEPGELLARYRAALPFALTRAPGAGDRARSTATSPAPCRCSGCSRATSAPGRRSVALYALLRAVERGYQGALMAPTETLAEQHFLTVDELCRELGVTVRPADELGRQAGARRRPPARRSSSARTR